jgi:hypothetical protein
MLAKRLPLLLVFAGGCLCGAVVIAFLPNDGEAVAPAAVPRLTEARQQEAVAPVEQDAQTETQAVVAPARSNAGARAPAQEPLEPSGSEAEAEGNSVADVLGRLEAEYRKGQSVPVVATPVASAVGEAPTAVAPAPAAAAPAQVAVAPVAPAPVAASVAPAVAPAPVAPPAPIAAATLPARPAAEPGLARHDALRPSDPAAANTPRNVHLENLHQGDVTQVQQQLALMQYFQVVTLPGEARASSAPQDRRRATARRAPQPSLHAPMNPDNPWGFAFPAPVLVK